MADDFASAVLESLPYAVIAADDAGRRLVVNRSARALSGPPPDSRSGEDWPATYSADGATLRPRGENPLVRALAGEEVRGLRVTVAPEEGTRTAVSVDAAAIRAADGQLRGAVVVMRAVDDSEPAASRSRIAAGSLEHLAAPVAAFSASSGEIAYTNVSWNRLFGYAEGEALGLHVSAAHRLGDEERPGERLQAIVRSLDRDMRWSGRLDSIRRDGTEFWSTVTISKSADDSVGDLWVALYPPSS